MPGHDPGHDWASYVDHFKREHGSWSALADELIRRASAAVDVPLDPGSVEKGLRRLAARKHKPGGDYGRWMLRFFGVPADIERTARWLGQYHSRLADLPTSLRLEQLLLWDRPPVSESKASAWIDAGLASVLHRRGDREASRARLERAQGSPMVAVQLETLLFAAYLARDRSEAEALLDRAEPLLDAPDVLAEDRACYRMRLIGQRAFHRAPNEALALFESIEDSEHPFVAARKHAGLAYCRWKLGDPIAADHARLSAMHAGDGGYLRFRAMALSMLAQIDPSQAEAGKRARSIARMLEDEALSGLVERRLQSAAKQ